MKNLQDTDLDERFAANLFEEAGFDLRGQEFGPFYVADIAGASSVGREDGH